MANTGITFADKYHTYRDWGLELISLYIPMPSPKQKIIDIPGGDGSIDLTEINGRPVYSDRDGIEIIFYLLDKSRSEWFLKYSDFAGCIHGRKVKMVLDDEPDHYYMARLGVDGKRTDPMFGQIVLSGMAEPFKYDLLSSAEEWLWDSLNFEKGVIRTLIDLTITEDNNTVKILGAGIDNAPVFLVTRSNGLALEHDGRSYSLKAGKNRFPRVRVGKEDVTLTFSGTGELSIDYRGRYL